MNKIKKLFKVIKFWKFKFIKYLLNKERTYKDVFDTFMNFYENDIKEESIDNYFIFSIWWDNLDNAPSLVINNMKNFKNKFKDKFILITKDNYTKYTNIDKNIVRLFEEKKLTIQTLTDIIRLNLLIIFGGIYLDSTVVLFDNFDPDEIIKYNLYSSHTVNEPYWPYWHNAKVSSFFLASNVKNNNCLNKALYLLNSFINKYNGIIDYLTIDIIFWYLLNYDNGSNEIINSIPENNIYNDLQFLAHNLDSTYDKLKIEELKENHTLNKSSYYVKPQHMLTNNGDLTYLGKFIIDTSLNSNSKEKVSVIIPCFNVENTISRCLNSVLYQTYTNFEIIIINDGSTDNTLNVLKEYLEKDERIKIFAIPNGGISNAYVYGFRKCSGDYITFIDSDDYLDFNFIKYTMDKIRDVDFVITNYYIFDDNTCYKQNYSYNSGIYDTFNSMLYVKINENRITDTRWAKLYKREVINKIIDKIDRTISFTEDVAFCNLLYKEAKSFYLLNKPMYYYYQTPTGMGKSFNHNKYEQMLKTFSILDNNDLAYKNQIILKVSLYYIGTIRQSNISKCDKLRYIKEIKKNRYFKEALSNEKWECHSFKQKLKKFLILRIPLLYIML